MGNQSIVLFYSWSGQTKKLAEMIAEKTGADLCELQPVIPYPQSYRAVVEQARKEIREKYHPELRPVPHSLESYQTVFIGTPNWCSTLAPPVAAFLYQQMPTEKVVVPFCTHGGGGAANIPRDIASYCLGCDVLPTLALRDGDEAFWNALLTDWLKRIALIRTSMGRQKG